MRITDKFLLFAPCIQQQPNHPRCQKPASIYPENPQAAPTRVGGVHRQEVLNQHLPLGQKTEAQRKRR